MESLLPGLSTHTLLMAALVIALAYTVFGLSGFGAGIVALPLLAQFMSIRFAVPLLLLLDLCCGALIGLRHHSSIARDELKRLLPFAALGMLLGVTVLASAPQRWLLLTLGVYTLCITAWSLWGPATARQVSTAMAPPLGTAGGIFGALFGTGGPLYSAYLTRRINDKHQLRATTSAVVFSTGVVRLGMFLVIGLYAQPGLLLSALWLLPCALAGFFLGSRLHARLPTRRVVQGVWALLLFSGASLVLRSTVWA
jgi:uncharacterized membrane protein YfcA